MMKELLEFSALLVNMAENQPRDEQGQFASTGIATPDYSKEYPPLTRIRAWSQEELLKRGADGHLSKGYERYIPLSKITGLEPTPASAEGQEYKKGKLITQPIEVIYSSDTDSYTLYAGNHRITQAKLNGQSHIPAFIEPDGKEVGESAVRSYPK